MSKLNETDIEARLTDLEGWQFIGKEIVKSFEFDSFSEALDFVNEVGDLAEDIGHHPKIIINIDNVKLRLTTHSEKGVTEKDFELAEGIEGI